MPPQSMVSTYPPNPSIWLVLLSSALGLIGKGTERDPRPTKDELNLLFRCFNDNEGLTLPMTRIVQFAVATAMRLDEICRVE